MHVTFKVCMHVIFRVCMHVTFGNITVLPRQRLLVLGFACLSLLDNCQLKNAFGHQYQGPI